MERWRYFVLLASMRTGSNLFEQTIKSSQKIISLGELFNPAFVGQPKYTRDATAEFDIRDADPISFLNAKIGSNPDQLIGFRFFDGHDHRILDHVLGDRSCAKVVLRRNPLDAFLSQKIARDTDQWRVADWAKRRTAQITFDASEFEKYQLDQAIYYETIFERLKRSGQTAFVISFDNLLDVDVWKGLFMHLGQPKADPVIQSRLIRQNPESVEKKVTNPKALSPYLGHSEQWSPHIAPRRMDHAPNSILVHPTEPRAWDLSNAFFSERLKAEIANAQILNSRSEIVEWQASNPAHYVTFYVEHPLQRAYRTYDKFVLAGNIRAGRKVRRNLAQFYNSNGVWDRLEYKEATQEDYCEGFETFLEYLKNHLVFKTKVQPNPEWDYQFLSLQNLQTLVPRTELVIQSLTPQLENLPFYSGKFKLYDILKPNWAQSALDAYEPDTVRFGFSV